MTLKSGLTRIALTLLSLTVITGLIFILCFAWLLGDYVAQKESISRGEATNFLNFNLVGSATNIFVCTINGGMQSCETFYRITVARQDITNQINLIIASDTTETNRAAEYQRQQIEATQIPRRPDLHWWNQPLYWWYPQNIRNGFYIGYSDEDAYQIWADQDSGMLFVYQF